jgi:hypothetical protein
MSRPNATPSALPPTSNSVCESPASAGNCAVDVFTGARYASIESSLFYERRDDTPPSPLALAGGAPRGLLGGVAGDEGGAAGAHFDDEDLVVAFDGLAVVGRGQ